VRSAEHGSVVRAPVAVGLVLAILTLFPTGAAGRSPTSRRPACDPIDPTACLLPFPNDFFTVPDPGTATGRRVDFAPSAMPRNNHGIAIDPADPARLIVGTFGAGAYQLAAARAGRPTAALLRSPRAGH